MSVTFAQSLNEMTSKSWYRTPTGAGVWAHFLPDNRVRLWFNVGPPMVHRDITVDHLEDMVALGHLRDPCPWLGGET